MVSSASPKNATREQLMSLDEAADLIGCSGRTVRRWIASGELMGYRYGPRILRVKQSDLEALATSIPSA